MDKLAEELADVKNANAEVISFHEILIKQEPLDQHCTETCPNGQGSQFSVVVKQEVCDDRSEMNHPRHTVNSVGAAVADTDCVLKIKPEPIEVEVSFPAEMLNTDNSQPAADGDTEMTANDEASALNNLLSEYNITCHRCHICDYQCAYRSILKKHILTIHSVDKPYCCKECDYRTANDTYFKRHLKIHRREKLKVAYVKPKPVQAEATSSTSTSNTDNSQPATDGDTVMTAKNDTYTLNHLLTEYNIECHRCSICNYQCAYSSVLRRHMSIHTGDKPHSCKHCDYKCKRASYLKQHMKIHTREKLKRRKKQAASIVPKALNHAKMETRCSKKNKIMDDKINVQEQSILNPT